MLPVDISVFKRKLSTILGGENLQDKSYCGLK